MTRHKPPAYPQNAEDIDEVVALISTLIYKAQRLLRQEALTLHPDLTSTGHSVLRLLATCEPLTVTGISDTLVLDKSIVSRQLRFLRTHGFLVTDPDPLDHRVRIVRLTAYGHTKLAGLARLGGTALRHRLHGWEPCDVEAFAIQLRRLLDLPIGASTSFPNQTEPSDEADPVTYPAQGERT